MPITKREAHYGSPKELIWIGYNKLDKKDKDMLK